MDFDLTEQKKCFQDNLRQWLQKHWSLGWGKTGFRAGDTDDTRRLAYVSCLDEHTETEATFRAPALLTWQRDVLV